MSDIEFCGICRYWEFWNKREHDEANGYCRRHAPAPISHILVEIARLVGRGAWAIEEHGNIEHDEDEDYLCESVSSYRIHEWPITRSSAWCGEFKLREGPLQHYYPNPRYEAAEKWEKENKVGEKNGNSE